jgi:hypothetical protein
MERRGMADIYDFMPIIGHFASPAGINLHPGFMDGKSGSSNLDWNANYSVAAFPSMNVLQY